MGAHFNLFLIINLFRMILALQKKYGNPDEWGPHFEGDIILVEGKRKYIDIEWANGVIPYQFEFNFDKDNKKVVQRAMNYYMNMTKGCIKFIEKTREIDYVHFVDDHTSCSSLIGRIGGRQEVSLPEWCLSKFGSVLHELLHTLGFDHEHTRADRDDYLMIWCWNIERGKEENFSKLPHPVSTLGEPYDYLSLLHYSSYAFTSNGKKTIIPFNTSMAEKIGQREGLSEIDIRKIRKMYKCEEDSK